MAPLHPFIHKDKFARQAPARLGLEPAGPVDPLSPSAPELSLFKFDICLPLGIRGKQAMAHSILKNRHPGRARGGIHPTTPWNTALLRPSMKINDTVR